MPRAIGGGRGLRRDAGQHSQENCG
jgi:hypothetical protein